MLAVAAHSIAALKLCHSGGSLVTLHKSAGVPADALAIHIRNTGTLSAHKTETSDVPYKSHTAESPTTVSAYEVSQTPVSSKPESVIVAASEDACY